MTFKRGQITASWNVLRVVDADHTKRGRGAALAAAVSGSQRKKKRAKQQGADSVDGLLGRLSSRLKPMNQIIYVKKFKHKPRSSSVTRISWGEG